MKLSPLQIARYQYQPKLPGMLRNGISEICVKNGEATTSVADQEKIAALFPNTYTNVQQIQSAARTVDPEQMQIIQQRVYTYFGTSEKILTNAATGDDWGAYYEGKIEPFALQLAQAMTAMTYSHNERARKNGIVWTANRLQYMTNADKLQVSSQMFDRGILSINDVMDIWALPHVPDGDKRYIRKEYTEISQLDQVAQLQAELAAAKAQPPTPEPDEGTGKEEPNGDTQPPDQV